MYDNGSGEGDSIADTLRKEVPSADATRQAVEDQLRRASQEMLGSTLPRDVHHRYATISSEQSAAIKLLADEIHHTLTTADAGHKVLSGKVAEKVKQGIAEITGHNDYTHAATSIS